jgi:hypothetical protein
MIKNPISHINNKPIIIKLRPVASLFSLFLSLLYIISDWNLGPKLKKTP